jgi:serine phosphatase RsbU (regulator of sigma subunit)
MVGPLPGPDGPLGMVYADTGETGRRFEGLELDYFIAILHQIATQLDAIFKHNAEQRAATMQGEVAVAHAIQARLTPRKLPQWDQLQWGAFREPGRERTTDIYDVVRTSTGHAAFMLAHTRATGAMPSMLMSQAQAAFRAAVMHNDPPNLYLRMMNILLYDGNLDRPLDCFMGLIEPASGELKYSVAGTIGAYVIGNRGEERPLRPDALTPPLGMDKAAAYPLLTHKLAPAENMVLFTPGVTTARNRHDEVFGEDRFVNILCDGFGQLASNMLKEMLSDLRNFTEGGKLPDDITVILAHRA